MRIVVTGASGFIGTALCRRLLSRGHTVRAAVRHSPPPAAPGLQHVRVPDIAADFDRGALLDDADAVVHLAAIAHRSASEALLRRVNVDATLRLAEAAAGRVPRFVFLSSVKVHGEDSGAGAFRESDSLRPEDDYGRSKSAAEQGLAELAARTGLELTVIRAPLVYGPGVKANFLRLLRWVDSGWPLPFGSLNNRRSLVGVDNLVDAIALCAEHPGADGPFLVGDAGPVSTPALVSGIASALGRPARLVRVPASVLLTAGALACRREEMRRLTGNLVVDASRARQVLNWSPLRSLQETLAETARWFRALAG